MADEVIAAYKKSLLDFSFSNDNCKEKEGTIYWDQNTVARGTIRWATNPRVLFDVQFYRNVQF